MHAARFTLPLALALALALATGSIALAQGGPSPRQTRARAVEALIAASGEDSLRRFVDEHLAASLREARTDEQLLALLRDIRATCAAAGAIGLEQNGADGVRMTFRGSFGRADVLFRVEPAPPHRITDLSFERGAAGEGDRSRRDARPWTWETLAARLDEAAAAGFSGTVLVVRNGKVFLHDGYGQADRRRGIANDRKTIFAIGSMPIDFTKAAVLKLVDLGKIRPADPIGKHLAGVPDDKRAITIDHLMSGRSGLPNFHHEPGVDGDYDLTWIDRDTAVRRILGKELLFAPGEGEAHSHSAWGLLAAIVETASGQSYIGFLREHIFGPAGMNRTGLFEDTHGFPEDQLAVGESSQGVGEVNSPRYWGRTSWLVMGSGGMVSTPADLHRFTSAVRHGDVLSPESRRRFGEGGIGAGANDRGFFCVSGGRGDTMVFVCSNSHGREGDLAGQTAGGLARFVYRAAGSGAD